jgi:hypothetical protein
MAIDGPALDAPGRLSSQNITSTKDVDMVSTFCENYSSFDHKNDIIFRYPTIANSSLFFTRCVRKKDKSQIIKIVLINDSLNLHLNYTSSLEKIGDTPHVAVEH